MERDKPGRSNLLLPGTRMTKEQILARYPNASTSFIARNLDYPSPPIRAHDEKPDQGGALECSEPGEEACWYGPAKRFEIRFTVYSVRPCDYDGWDIKAIQDCLVRAQIIPDDGWRVLAGRVESRKVHAEADERTEIKIVTVE